MTPEPTANVLNAVWASVGAMLFTSLGLEPGPLFWSLVGASLGMSFATATTRLRALSVFVAVSLTCSLFGVYLAVRYQAGETLSRNAFACLLAIFFHPILNALVGYVPAMVDTIMKRFGLTKTAKGKRK